MITPFLLFLAASTAAGGYLGTKYPQKLEREADSQRGQSIGLCEGALWGAGILGLVGIFYFWGQVMPVSNGHPPATPINFLGVVGSIVMAVIVLIIAVLASIEKWKLSYCIRLIRGLLSAGTALVFVIILGPLSTVVVLVVGWLGGLAAAGGLRGEAVVDFFYGGRPFFSAKPEAFWSALYGGIAALTLAAGIHDLMSSMSITDVAIASAIVGVSVGYMTADGKFAPEKKLS